MSRLASIPLALAALALATQVLGCPAADPGLRSTSRTIDRGGGSVELGAGDVAITVPAGALAAPTEIGIADVRSADVAALPRAGAARSRRYALTPHGAVFATPVEVAIRFSGAASGVSVLRLDDEADPSWETIESTIAGDVARVVTDRFSVMVVSGPILEDCGDPGDPCCSEGAEIGPDPDADGCADPDTAVSPNTCLEDSCVVCEIGIATVGGACATQRWECDGGRRTVCIDVPPPPMERIGGTRWLCCD